PKFTDLLSGATLSISQCGYNTCVDILQSGIRSIVVPFATGGETEQTQRGEILQSKGRVRMISENDLDVVILTKAVRELLQQKNHPLPNIDLMGADNSARILENLLD
ncbi:MAG: glycosyltransferase, partial [Methyloligellaceae bacterium]